MIANHPGFCVCMTIILNLADAASDKIAAVYGQIDENGGFVRKRLARKMAIMDKMVKNSLLSVRFQTFWPQFYGQKLQKVSFVRKFSS